MHICVGRLSNIGSDNGLLPGRRQAIIWTNAGILLIGPLRTNFSEIAIKIHIFSFKKMYLKMLSGNWQPSFSGLNVLRGGNRGPFNGRGVSVSNPVMKISILMWPYLQYGTLAWCPWINSHKKGQIQHELPKDMPSIIMMAGSPYQGNFLTCWLFK